MRKVLTGKEECDLRNRVDGKATYGGGEIQRRPFLENTCSSELVTLKLLGTYPSSSVKEKLEEPGEDWLKISMWGQFMASHESLGTSKSTWGESRECQWSSRRDRTSHIGGKRAERQQGDEEANGPPSEKPPVTF